ncbi:hypothetical protein AA313_de0202980 [Arthrobotrys entomopaga]|nr:hypothetical protein AA313_de0202980 [Arthrobotrys entomopaga]
MKAGKFVLWAALAGLTSAQTNALDLPACARSCISGDTGNCNSLDVSCLCNSQAFVSSIEICLIASCSADDIQASANYLQQLCNTVGVSISELPNSPADTTSVQGDNGGGLQQQSSTTTTPSPPSPTSTTPTSTPSSSTPTPSSSSTSNRDTPPTTTISDPSSKTSTDTPQSSTDSPPPSSKSGLTGGAIAGIVVGVAVPVIVIIAFVAYKMGTRDRLPDAPVVPINNDPSRKDFGALIGGIEDMSTRWGTGIQDNSSSRPRGV